MFPIVYKQEHFTVDPSFLYDSSKKFQKLINENVLDRQTIHLRISYDNLSPRNINNFLKICQNQQTDVQNDELKEICLIAKIFQAEQIYDTGLNFIQNNIDSNFFIPDKDFDEMSGNQYLFLEPIEEKPLIHHLDMDELEFEDSTECPTPELSQSNNTNSESQNQNQKQQIHSVCYQITEDIPLLKRTRFYFSKGNHILYMAKPKKNDIYIGEGTNLHISDNKFENSAKISRTNENCVVNTDDQEFKITFIKSRESYSLATSFVNKGVKHIWKPKDPKSSTEFNGEYNHIPMSSKKNIILQNSNNRPTLIIRKMSNKVIEVECHPNVNPIIIFSIALSQILGPATL